MKVLLLVTALFAGTVSADGRFKILNDIFALPVAELPIILAGGGPTNNDGYNCDLPHLGVMLQGFNNYLGISPDYGWKNASGLYTQVDTFLSASTDNYIKTCDARKLFFRSLGTTYWDCTNALFLLQHLPAGGDIVQPYAFNAMWTQLDFICNGGLEIGIQSFKDIMKFYGTTVATQCYVNFHRGVTTDPNQLCSYVNTYMNCMQEGYILNAQNRPNGWWLCERIRVGYGKACPDLRCVVITA